MKTDFLICYRFTFSIRAYSKNGRIYNSHKVKAVGLSYDLAFWDFNNTLKQRSLRLIKINDVTVDRIEFALDKFGKPINLLLSDYMPHIPELE